MARILILEDDPDQLELRKLLLANAGHQVQTAVSAEQAAAAMADSDVLVLDLVPGSEHLLDRVPPDTHVIVLSGRQVVSDQVTAKSSYVLKKPCSSRTLIDTIGRACKSA